MPKVTTGTAEQEAAASERLGKIAARDDSAAPLTVAGSDPTLRPARLIFETSFGLTPLDYERHNNSTYLRDTADGLPIYVSQLGRFWTLAAGKLIEEERPSTLEKKAHERLLQVAHAVTALRAYVPTPQHGAGMPQEVHVILCEELRRTLGVTLQTTDINGRDADAHTLLEFDSVLVNEWATLGDLTAQEEERHKVAMAELNERLRLLLEAQGRPFTRAWFLTAQAEIAASRKPGDPSDVDILREAKQLESDHKRVADDHKRQALARVLPLLQDRPDGLTFEQIYEAIDGANAGVLRSDLHDAMKSGTLAVTRQRSVGARENWFLDRYQPAYPAVVYKVRSPHDPIPDGAAPWFVSR